MEASDRPTIDKSTWGDGPWQQEPDRWEGEHEGFPLLAVRQPNHGAWCGYVAVPPGHPWHGAEPDASVHGGVTYGAKCFGDICHVPKPGEPDDVYWVGFDCVHAFDLAPAHEADLPQRLRMDNPSVYRTLDYVQAECRNLAEQAKAARLDT